MVVQSLTFQFFCTNKFTYSCWTRRRCNFGVCRYSQRAFSPYPYRTLLTKLSCQRLGFFVSMETNDSARERTSIFDLTVEEVAEDYGLPLEYVIDTLISNGVEEPIYPTDILSKRVKEIRKMEVLEALSFSDAIEIGDLYLQPTVAEIAQANGLTSSQVLTFLRKEGFEAPLGPRTRIPPHYISAVDEHITKYLSRFRSQ